MNSLKNKVVIVTGASSGIGRATALRFAKKEAAVVLAARRLKKLQELYNDISAFNANCLVVKTDVTSIEEVAHLFDKTKSRFGRVDLLVNNAGRGLKAPICDITYDDWLSVLHTNLSSVFLCSREALLRMIPQKNGHIITVGSIAGLYGTPNYAAYCAAKHGVTGFQRSLKWEARRHGIKVSTIFPGRVDTEFFDDYPKRPSRRQMLSADDLAAYIIAIAEKKWAKREMLKIVNFSKRIINAIL